tara:strand:- start:452 stop:946 length:495 start_codon:yes stop_codon:yes gene_type:complete
MDPYSTHLPILKNIIDNTDIKSVFEFGSGLHSTQLFAENCDDVITCDIDEEWYNTISDKFKDYKNVSPILHKDHEWGSKTPESIAYLKQLNRRFDLIFIDCGDAPTRPHCVNAASKFTDLIIAHDTDAPAVIGYNWHLVELKEPEWRRTDYKDVVPWTTVWERM